MVWVDGLFFGCGSGDLSSVPIVVSFDERTIGAEPKSLLRPVVVESAYKVSLRHSSSGGGESAYKVSSTVTRVCSARKISLLCAKVVLCI